MTDSTWTIALAVAAVQSHQWHKDNHGRQRCNECGARPWTPLSACGAHLDTPELVEHRREALAELQRRGA